MDKKVIELVKQIDIDEKIWFLVRVDGYTKKTFVANEEKEAETYYQKLVKTNAEKKEEILASTESV